VDIIDIYDKAGRCGLLEIRREKLYVIFLAECEYRKGIWRLYAENSDLGVLEPKGDKMVLKKKISLRELSEKGITISTQMTVRIAAAEENDEDAANEITCELDENKSCPLVFCGCIGEVRQYGDKFILAIMRQL